MSTATKHRYFFKQSFEGPWQAFKLAVEHGYTSKTLKAEEKLAHRHITENESGEIWEITIKKVKRVSR
jgi:hypothetical protein